MLSIVLARLFAATGTIVRLMVVHALLNISGSVTAANPQFHWLVLAANTVISAAYAAYLVEILRQPGTRPEVAWSFAESSYEASSRDGVIRS